MTTEFELPPVKFSRLSKRGLLLGLTVTQLACLGVSAVAIIAALYAGGSTAFIASTPIWLTGTVLALVPVGGRKLVDWLPITGIWWLRSWKGQTVFLRRIFRRRPAKNLALPGDAAALKYHIDPATAAVMIHDPHEATLTAIIRVKHPSFVLLDPAEQNRRVQAWGRVLATCCRSGRLARVQVLERTLPDNGTGLAEWWQEQGTADNSWPARVYADLIDRAGPAAERHETTISIALDMTVAAKAIRAAGGGVRGAAAVLGGEMHVIATALRAAELTPSGWLTADDLAVMLHAAYDPNNPTDSRRLRRELAEAGPMGVYEKWANMRTDSAYHAVLWVSQWPQSQVFPGFLAPIMLSAGIRRSVSLIAQPLRADQAAKDLRRKKTEHVANASQRAKIGQIEDAEMTAEYADVLKQEADLTSGHGIVRYTGLIAVSAPTLDALTADVSAIEQAATQASLETRILVGQQAKAFTAAALPLTRPV